MTSAKKEQRRKNRAKNKTKQARKSRNTGLSPAYDAPFWGAAPLQTLDKFDGYKRTTTDVELFEQMKQAESESRLAMLLRFVKDPRFDAFDSVEAAANEMFLMSLYRAWMTGSAAVTLEWLADAEFMADFREAHRLADEQDQACAPPTETQPSATQQLTHLTLH
jgi:hypothetical protein